LTVQQRRCTTCGRILYEHGHARIIEAACTTDGRAPAEEFLAGLAASKKQKDRDRITDVAMLLEEYAREGQLEITREINYLRDDLWEIKPGDVRLPYYLVVDTLHDAPVARLTSGFLKTQHLTQHRHINWGLRVAREDKGQDIPEERRQIEGESKTPREDAEQ
jgi:hypothetical protein